MKDDYASLVAQLPDFEQSINSSRELIASLFHLELLKCNGNPPNLANLSEKQLKGIAFFAFHDHVINILPEQHTLHYTNFSGNPAILNNMLRKDIEGKLMVMLQARNYKLSDEVIQFVISTKLNSIYNRASETLGEVITKLEELPNSPPEAQELIAAYKEAAAPLLTNKKRDITNCYTRCLEAFLESLRAPPDVILEVNPEARLGRIVSVLIDSQLTLDLRGVDLHPEIQALFKLIPIDTSKIKLLLRPDQQEMYLQIEQQKGRTFFEAAKKGNIKIIEKFCKQGMVNYINSQGRTALMVASMANQVDAVRALLSHGANVHACTTSRTTIIEGLSRFKDNSLQKKQIVELLIKARADITKLHIAAAFGDLADMNMIYPARQVDHKVKGNAPIHIAAIHGHVGNLNWLCNKEADINSINVHGSSPLDLAYENGNHAAIEFFTSRGAVTDVPKAIDATIRNGHDALVIRLTDQHGCNPETINATISYRHFLLARELIDRHGYNAEQMRMLKAALKDILLLSLVSRNGFLPAAIPISITWNTMCFISGSCLTINDARKLREEVICINTMAIQRKFARRIEAPQESQELGM